MSLVNFAICTDPSCPCLQCPSFSSAGDFLPHLGHCPLCPHPGTCLPGLFSDAPLSWILYSNTWLSWCPCSESLTTRPPVNCCFHLRLIVLQSPWLSFLHKSRLDPVVHFTFPFPSSSASPSPLVTLAWRKPHPGGALPATFSMPEPKS